MSNKVFDVFVSKKSEKEDRTFYTKVGRAWLKVTDAGEQIISMELEALPVNGRLVCFEPRKRDEGEKREDLPRGGRR